MFSLKTVVLALATAVAIQAAPAPNPGPTVEMALNQCGSNNVVSCCNSKNTNAGGLLGGVDLLGGNCSPLDLAAVGANIPIKSQCKSAAACCSGDQFGLVNIACTPITL